jgi:hypothetical protein
VTRPGHRIRWLGRDLGHPAAGGKDEGAVGRRGFWPNAYAGYCRDLDGNKLAAYCTKAE